MKTVILKKILGHGKFALSAAVLLLSALMTLTSCGGGGGDSNDQGVTFTALGFFQPKSASTDDGQPDDFIGLSYYEMYLSSVADIDGTSGVPPSIYIGMTNNLSGQFIRTKRVYTSYFVPGSSVQPPSSNFVYTDILLPSNNDFNTSLPDNLVGDNIGEDAVGTTVFAGLPLLTNQVRAWLNLNRASLPEAPFDLEATAEIEGVTSAGDQITSNSVTLLIRVLPDALIPGTSGGSSSDSLVSGESGVESDADADAL